MKIKEMSLNEIRQSGIEALNHKLEVEEASRLFFQQRRDAVATLNYNSLCLKSTALAIIIRSYNDTALLGEIGRASCRERV